MERKFVRLILHEDDHGVLVPDDIGLPYENLVKAAYKIFDQDPTRVKVSLHYKTKDLKDHSDYLVDEQVWNFGRFFNNLSVPIDRFHCRFTPIERDEANHPDLGTFGGRRDSVNSAPPNAQYQPFSRSTGAEATDNDLTPSLQDDMTTITSDGATQELTPEQQPKRKAAPRAQQGHAPPTHKRIRPFSPRQYLPTKEQQAAKAGSQKLRRGRSARMSAPQNPSPFTRRREVSQNSEGPRDLPDGQQLETEETGATLQPEPSPVREPQTMASLSPSSPLSPVREEVLASAPEHLFLTPSRRASADQALFRNRARGSQNVLDPPRRASFDTRVLRPRTGMTHDAAGPCLDSVEEGADNGLPRHGAPGRKNESIDLTFFFKSEIKGHANLKIQKWTVAYQGSETLQKREEEIRTYIFEQLYDNNPKMSERQRQGIVNQLAIFVYVYYQNTNDRQDVIPKKTSHEYALWEFLLANIKDSEPAKLEALVTMHRTNDVDMTLLNRLSPTGSRSVETNDEDDSDEEVVAGDPVDTRVRVAEEKDGEYEEDGEGDGNKSDG
ncbi:hypothetical protein IWZ00DRAFT_350340 [Phyllosticta capitalensis]